MNRYVCKAAFKESIPVMMGYIFLGFAFGVLLVSNQYPIYYGLLMSICIYAGSMQFVAISLLNAETSIINAIFMTCMINARHVFYGLSMLEKFSKCEEFKPYMIFSLTDETYSLLVKDTCPKDCSQKHYMFLLSFFNQLYWITGTLLGGLLGSTISFNATGLDFSMTALFVVIVVEQYRHNTIHTATYIGFAISLLCLYFFGADQFIIPSMIGILLCLLISKPYMEDKHE